MFEQVGLGAQALSVALIAGWLTTGLRDNVLYPRNNELFTQQVMEMTRMRTDYPDEYARVAHRAITDRRLQRLLFRLVVLAEVAAALVLWIGVAMLALALIGAAAPDTARAWAMAGAALFTAIWGGFLVVGNHFSYWFCHEAGQNTHYQMTLWGMANMIFLAVA